ncbi:glycosyltransferase [bacterium]|nr:glycosyltransferase [bacterium]
MIKIKYVIADGSSFEAITQRVHHLAGKLSKDEYVLYIEEPGNIVSVFLSQEKPISNLWRWKEGLRLVRKNTYVFTPPVMLPFGYILPSVNAFNHFIQGLFLRLFLKGIDLSNATVIVPNILGKAWRHFFLKSPMVYDCCDEITEFKIPSMRRDVVKREEIDLMHDSDLVVVSSQLLYEKKRIYNNNMEVIRNGCEYEFFARTEELRDSEPPADIANIKRLGPVIGFFGNISTWFDIDIISGILNKHNKWQIVLIGPVFISKERLKAFPNCHFLGKKPYSELPRYLAHFDCGIIPFMQNELTKYVNPVKAYEYLAGGVGVVGTPLDEYKYFDNHVIQADSADGFVKAIEQVMRQNYREARARRMEFAKKNDWQERLDGYVKLITAAEKEHAGKLSMLSNAASTLAE